MFLQACLLLLLSGFGGIRSGFSPLAGAGARGIALARLAALAGTAFAA